MSNEWIIEIIRDMEESKAYGSLRLNFQGGTIVNINKEESIIKPKEQGSLKSK
jgi:hypothetical protein